jgi:heptosyltransferase II
MAKKILILKFGAMGDVLRTTPILRELGKKDFIGWVTDKECVPILEKNSYVNEIFVFDFDTTLMELEKTKWDEIYCLDEDPRALAIALVLNTKTVMCLDTHWYKMSISNYDKRVNTNSYQFWLFKGIGLNWKGQEYVFEWDHIPKPDSKIKIGIETRVGDKWPTKNWNKWPELEKALIREKYEVIRFKPKEFDEYVEDIDSCDLVITPDTLTMHLALALKKQVIALFTSTSANEIYDYGRLVKLISPVDCGCCYKKRCDDHKFVCTKGITVDMIKNIVDELVVQKGIKHGREQKDRQTGKGIQAKPASPN